MATEKDIELLESYLTNQLEGQDKRAVEKLLETDMDFKKEFEFQKQLVEGIKRERVAELKQMLANVPVPASVGMSALTKASIAVMSAAVIGSIWYFLQKPETSPVQKITESIETPVREVPVPQQEEPQQIVAEPQVAEEEHVKVADRVKQADRVTKQEVTAAQPQIEVYDPTQEMSEDAGRSKEENFSDSKPATISVASIAVETDNANKKLDFHYQFKNGKLLLYGSFEKNLYEILEFISNNKRTVFLYYNSNYYLLDEKQEKPEQLKAITDANLLKKLNEYQNR